MYRYSICKLFISWKLRFRVHWKGCRQQHAFESWVGNSTTTSASQARSSALTWIVRVDNKWSANDDYIIYIFVNFAICMGFKISFSSFIADMWNFFSFLRLPFPFWMMKRSNRTKNCISNELNNNNNDSNNGNDTNKGSKVSLFPVYLFFVCLPIRLAVFAYRKRINH